MKNGVVRKEKKKGTTLNIPLELIKFCERDKETERELVREKDKERERWVMGS